MFFGVIRQIRHFYTSGAGSFAFKSSFSYRIFRFSCQAVVSPGRKMAPKFKENAELGTRALILAR
jgi:hypothetical protein